MLLPTVEASITTVFYETFTSWPIQLILLRFLKALGKDHRK
jgi:hypothetical protein